MDHAVTKLTDGLEEARHVRHDAALQIVRRYVWASAAVGIIPIPGVASYALGRVMMAHFENGGSLDSFDAKDLAKLMWWRRAPAPAIAPAAPG